MTPPTLGIRSSCLSDLTLREGESMATLTSHKFVQDADATTWVSLQRSTENNQEREKVATRQFALIRRLIASFKEAFDFPSEPPLCFYLEGCPFLEDPFDISTPDLGNVCILNGVTFYDDRNLGRQICIEDRDGLFAAVCAEMSWGGRLADLHAITRWRRYLDDDKTLVQSIEGRR